jgi:hypothetical protein
MSTSEGPIGPADAESLIEGISAPRPNDASLGNEDGQRDYAKEDRPTKRTAEQPEPEPIGTKEGPEGH